MLDENSLLAVVATRWVPPLITVVVGGYLASIIFPKLQARAQRVRAAEDRRLQLAEEVVRSLTRYTAAWRRLRTIAQLEIDRDGGLTEIERGRKSDYVQGRMQAKDDLVEAVGSLSMYCCSETETAVRDFLRWDDRCSALRLEELPPQKEFEQRRDQLIAIIGREVSS